MNSIEIEAIEIGKEIMAINAAIEEAHVGYGNAGRKQDFYESKLFNDLCDRRERLRRRLVEMG